MNSRNSAELLAEILNAQVEDAPPEATPTIWRQAILGQGRLTAREENILWTSPSARAAFLRLRHELLAPARDAWRDRGHDNVVTLRAAASEAGEQVVEGNGWRLSVTPVAGDDWVLTLQVDSAVAALIPPSAQLRLVDGEGLIWGQGVPGSDGGLDLDWPHDGSPLERLRRTNLRLEIV
ncbi:MAG: hypothetical protein WDM91_00115 [Rhizomicrobium sp.]